MAARRERLRRPEAHLINCRLAFRSRYVRGLPRTSVAMLHPRPQLGDRAPEESTAQAWFAQVLPVVLSDWLLAAMPSKRQVESALAGCRLARAGASPARAVGSGTLAVVGRAVPRGVATACRQAAARALPASESAMVSAATVLRRGGLAARRRAAGRALWRPV